MGDRVAGEARQLLLPVDLQAGHEVAKALGQGCVALDLDLTGKESILLTTAHPQAGQGQRGAAQQAVRIGVIGAIKLETLGTRDEVEAAAKALELEGDDVALQGCQAAGGLGVQGDVLIDGGLEDRQGGVRERGLAHSLKPR